MRLPTETCALAIALAGGACLPGGASPFGGTGPRGRAEPDPGGPGFVDEDGDGYEPARDCDDRDPTVHPGAPELCDGVDNDCDEEVDEDVAELPWYRDDDGDGWGTDDDVLTACSQPDGFVRNGGDCDDERSRWHPGGWVEGQDADCDGRVEWLLTITLTVDDEYELCVDRAEPLVGWDNDWEDAESYEVRLDAGVHVVGIRGEDDDDAAAFAIAELSIANGQRWFTNTTWVFDPEPDDGPGRNGWCGVDFDDTDWRGARMHGPWGVWPYGQLPEELWDTPANWIWDDVPYQHQTQYFRLVLELPNTPLEP